MVRVNYCICIRVDVIGHVIVWDEAVNLFTNDMQEERMITKTHQNVVVIWWLYCRAI